MSCLPINFLRPSIVKLNEIEGFAPRFRSPGLSSFGRGTKKNEGCNPPYDMYGIGKLVFRVTIFPVDSFFLFCVNWRVLTPPAPLPLLEHREDAERVMKVLGHRLERYGLRLALDKTRLLDFRRPAREQQRGKGPGTFDFLGFTHHWRRSRSGVWHPAWKTRTKSLRKAIVALQVWCKANLLSCPRTRRATRCRTCYHYSAHPPCTPHRIPLGSGHFGKLRRGGKPIRQASFLPHTWR